MIMGLIGAAAGLFCGAMIGWTRGYEAKEKDNARIEREMHDFWKEGKKYGV